MPWRDTHDGDGLVARAKLGESDAVAALWRMLNPAVLRYLRSLGTDDAEDVASVVWIELARALPGLREDTLEAVRRLLFTIARRRMIDHRRRSHLTVVAEHDADPVAELDGPLADALRLLRGLPPAQAEVVALREIVGFSPAEVAEMTGRSEGAVRVMHHRALSRLRQTLAVDVGQGDQGDVPAVTVDAASSMNELA